MYDQGEGVTQDFHEALFWYRNSGDQGYVNAQFCLAIKYATGQGVREDDAEAVRWHSKAADQGHAELQYRLGARYRTGLGVPKDEAEAIRWFRKAAEQGNSSAQNDLGMAYAQGKGVPQDGAEAVKWLLMAADQSQDSALNNLGAIYYLGLGVPRDCVEAEKWTRKAANRGHPNAQFSLGTLYSAGIVVPQDRDLAINWFRQAADQGQANAQRALGHAYAEGEGVPQDHTEAAKWYRKAADQGNSDARDQLDKLYNPEAVTQLKALADNDDANAQNDLGNTYAQGNGVPVDDAEAVKWYRKAADHGHAKGQVLLGFMLGNGRGVPRDYAEAVRWYRKAADQEDDASGLSAAVCKRHGVPQDDVEAAKWCRKAVSGLQLQESELRASYAEKKAIYDRLVSEIAALEDKVNFAELGHYVPIFSFDSSSDYAEALGDVKQRQEQMTRSDRAAVCPTEWYVSESRHKGEVMTRRAIRLALRAFNNECEAVIGKVSWRNFEAMRDRIGRSFRAINNMNLSNHVTISQEFLALKFEELILTHEERLKKQEEAQALREARARERENCWRKENLKRPQKRLQMRKSVRQRHWRRPALNWGLAMPGEHEALRARIEELQARLAEAQTAKERALSMAQQTRIGHVYIISNIGSFGDGVFKIGMTRRVEPMDRVRELGDASVPFPFDVHAMIFTKDAPALERALHGELDRYRLNRPNWRKEFFRVPFPVVKETVARQFPDALLVETSDAREYFASLPGDDIDDLAERQRTQIFPAAV